MTSVTQDPAGVRRRNSTTVTGNPAGRPIVFAHGFGCSQEMWRPVADQFEGDYTVVTFDHVGSGRSDLSAYDRAKYDSLHGYAADLLELLDELDLEDVVFVGHSVSATIGVLASIEDPSRFGALILVGPSARYVDDGEYRGGFTQQDIDLLLDALDSNYLGWSRSIAPVIMANGDQPRLGDDLAASFCSMNPEIARHFARVTFLSDNRRDLPDVTIPSLILQCRDDVIAPLAVGEFVHAGIPGSTMVVLDATGHCPNLSAPDLVADEIPGLPSMTAAGIDDGSAREESFEELYQHAPCGYLSTTADGSIVSLNDTFLHWTGYSRDELLGTAFIELLDGGGRLFYETRQLPVLQLQGEVREVALTLRRADDSALSVLVNSVLVTDDAGDPRLIRTAVFDATARADYEHQLLVARRDAEQAAARVRILQDASAAFAAVDTEAAFDRALIESFQSAFDASEVVLFGLDESGALRLKSGATPLDAHLGDEPDRQIAAAAMSGELVTVSSPDEADSRFPVTAAAMRAARYDALTATALMHDGVVFGVVSCLFRRQRVFDDHTVGIQAALARQAAQVLGRIRLQRELEQLALHDQLTKLANRTLIENTIQVALDRAATKRRAIALIFVDLDGFKTINDELGHITGDSVLQEVAARLRGAVRRDDIVGRLGGDEFLVVCDDADDRAVATIAERIRASIRRPLEGGAAGFVVSASIGVAVHRSSGAIAVAAAQMIGFADSAMYASKQAGKDRVTLVSV